MLHHTVDHKSAVSSAILLRLLRQLLRPNLLRPAVSPPCFMAVRMRNSFVARGFRCAGVTQWIIMSSSSSSSSSSSLFTQNEVFPTVAFLFVHYPKLVLIKSAANLYKR
eukprot:COSAG06_NODE_4718_length_4012_cov_1.906210_3_plen_109_part_00